MAKEVKKDTIHADGIDIGVYTTDYVNEFISLTDIAKNGKANIPDMLFRTGCDQEVRFPLLVYGRFYIIPISIASNSRQLKMKRATTVLL